MYNAGNSTGLGFTLLAIFALVYFIPSFVAVSRPHPQKLPIILINVFAGWTFVGWMVALVWSVMAFPAQPQQQSSAPLPSRDTWR